MEVLRARSLLIHSHPQNSLRSRSISKVRRISRWCLSRKRNKFMLVRSDRTVVSGTLGCPWICSPWACVLCVCMCVRVFSGQPNADVWFSSLSASDQAKVLQGTDPNIVFQFLQQVNSAWQQRFASVKQLIHTSNRAEVAAKVMQCVYQARTHGQQQSRLFAGTRGIGKV